MNDYDKREYTDFIRTVNARRLGDWRGDMPDPLTAVDRIDWLLNGSYGHGAKIWADRLVNGYTHDRVGKNLEKAYKSAGRELTVMVALLDHSEFTARKITEVWKKSGVDFDAINTAAARAIRDFLEIEAS
jgi:hypothetical protein